MLKRCIPKFRRADVNDRERMIKDAANNIKSAWTEDIEYDGEAIIAVCELVSEIRLFSDISTAAYSRVSVRQN
jgi:hypothetical protein